MLNDLVQLHLGRVAIDKVMGYLEQLTAYDRYQASLGIEQVAAVVACAAEALGLADVSVQRFPADGTTRWWTFEGPRSWTPMTARLEVRGGGHALVIDHATQPMSIATYSAATPAAGLVAPLVDLAGDVNGAVALVRKAEFARSDLVADLVARGAFGFVTDGPCRGASGEHVGRIELGADTSLFAFSITARQREMLETWTRSGATAAVRIDVDRSAQMPVVTALLPGKRPGRELWLTSHLCHPRPGANDNASGAAALLGVAAALHGRELDTPVRFVWGPEFVGVAALLHKLGSDGLPAAVINLDMVGEDQAQGGGPLVVERSPAWCPSLLVPLAEYVTEQVFLHTSAHPGSWRSGPFLGYSDHALFSTSCDPAGRSPAVQFWHPDDPFNHSAADTLDKVAEVELRRATAAAAVLAEVLASERAWPRAAIVERFCEQETAAARIVAQTYARVDGGEWSRGFLDYTRRRNTAVRSLVSQRPSVPQRCSGRWPGPLNIRALLASLEPDSRHAVAELIRLDKRNYALLLYLAMHTVGGLGRDEVIRQTSFAWRAPLDAAVAHQLWAALLESEWVRDPDDNR